MKQDVQIHVKLDTYVKLSELKARLRKRSFDEVIKELVKAFEACVAGTTGTTSVVGTASVAKTGADVTSTTSASPATVVEVYDGE